MIELTDNEVKVLISLYEGSDTWGEMCVSFAYIKSACDDKLTLKEVAIACRSLREKGLAEFYRGLMDEDGAVAGSGYCITKAGQLLLHACIDCKVTVADMDDGRCEECWKNRACTKCGKPYKEHETDWSRCGYKKEFEYEKDTA